MRDISMRFVKRTETKSIANGTRLRDGAVHVLGQAHNGIYIATYRYNSSVIVLEDYLSFARKGDIVNHRVEAFTSSGDEAEAKRVGNYLRSQGYRAAVGSKR